MPFPIRRSTKIHPLDGLMEAAFFAVRFSFWRRTEIVPWNAVVRRVIRYFQGQDRDCPEICFR